MVSGLVHLVPVWEGLKALGANQSPSIHLCDPSEPWVPEFQHQPRELQILTGSSCVWARTLHTFSPNSAFSVDVSWWAAGRGTLQPHTDALQMSNTSFFPSVFHLLLLWSPLAIVFLLPLRYLSPTCELSREPPAPLHIPPLAAKNYKHTKTSLCNSELHFKDFKIHKLAAGFKTKSK